MRVVLVFAHGPSHLGAVTDALSTMLRLLGEESEAASWLMEPVEPCDEKW